MSDKESKPEPKKRTRKPREQVTKAEGEQVEKKKKVISPEQKEKTLEILKKGREKRQANLRKKKDTTQED